jgi:hypothetical protein
MSTVHIYRSCLTVCRLGWRFRSMKYAGCRFKLMNNHHEAHLVLDRKLSDTYHTAHAHTPTHSLPHSFVNRKNCSNAYSPPHLDSPHACVASVAALVRFQNPYPATEGTARRDGRLYTLCESTFLYSSHRFRPQMPSMVEVSQAVDSSYAKER